MDAYKIILDLTDEAIPYITAAAQTDPNRRDYGAFIIPSKGFAEPSATGSAAGTLVAAYCCAGSRFHKDEKLLDAAISAFGFLNGACHSDGSIDLIETNFHDATSNGFTVQNLAYTYRLLELFAKNDKENTAKNLVRAFLTKSASAMLTGGFHTPNHRWVVASALALCHRCLGDPECLEMAKIYLSEGIDMNAEGDYTERSVGIYDAVNNESLAIIAQELGMEELYAHIDKNLEKNWYYTEPDLSGFTLASRRQDYGNETQMVRHFYAYYQAASRSGNGRFAWIANRLLEQIVRLKKSAGTQNERAASLHHGNLLARFMLNPALKQPAEEAAPFGYDRFFTDAGVVRYRRGPFTCGLLRDNGTFMKLQYEDLKIYVKLACTFFAHGRLVAQDIEPIAGGYRLTCENEWGYTRPLPGIGEPDWKKIDHQSREKANMQRHRWQADVIFNGNGADMIIKTAGTPGIPFKLEFILPPGGLLKTGALTAPAPADGWAIAGDTVIYDYGGLAVKFGGCFNEHAYAAGMRNSDPRPAGRFCLYCTGFTPADQRVGVAFGGAAN